MFAICFYLFFFFIYIFCAATVYNCVFLCYPERLCLRRFVLRYIATTVLVINSQGQVMLVLNYNSVALI